MWHRLSLRMRILLGYGVGLAIMAVLVGLLLIRLEHIKDEMISLNATSASEAQIGAQLASQAALAQQAVNRYLQQPQDAYLKQARRALDSFSAEITRQQTMLTSEAQQARAADLATQLTKYRDTFDRLDSLLNEQLHYRSDNTRYIIQASALTSRFIYKDLNDKTTERLNLLITLQSNLQAASTTAGRMVTDQDPDLGYLASTSLYTAKARLQSLNYSIPSSSMQDALHSVTSAISSTAQLATNITELNRIRTTDLVTQSLTLQDSADTIAQGALGTLREASTDLEQQMRTTEQAAVIALLVTLAVTLLMGIQLSRKLTQPLNDLATATKRINQGDYRHTVAKKEGGEIGMLIAAFNQMTASLLEQHTKVEQQQTAMAERNCELEQALAQLQRTIAERESLASTVRSLSVPVIPILDKVIVVPLVGEMDLNRAQVLLERLLHGVTSQRARLAILDITGVPVIDSAAANWLLQTARAVELLGARTILAGTSPEVAQALVASGADLSRVHATVDLRAAVEYALRPAGRALIAPARGV